jgi:hypothetical protein
VGSITPYFFFWTAFTHAAVSTSFCAPKPGSQRTNPFQVDVRHHITAVSAFPSCPSLRAPPHIAEYLLHVINYFGSDDQPRERFQAHIPSLMMQQPRPLGPPGNTASLTTLLNIQHNIKFNHLTTLLILYTYEDSNVYHDVRVCCREFRSLLVRSFVVTNIVPQQLVIGTNVARSLTYS